MSIPSSPNLYRTGFIPSDRTTLEDALPRLYRTGFIPSDRTTLEDALPRPQIIDASTSSNPDNYRISPASATAAGVGFKSVWEDWSGRGSHAEFLPDEVLPLKEGRSLGHGVMGGVYETTVAGHTFAWKRRYCRRAITQVERKEIEILKKLSHTHIIRLVGTYTHRQFLGLLLYPVAVCDLATFLEDFETMSQPRDTVSAQEIERLAAQGDRLRQLGLPTYPREDFQFEAARWSCSKIGCLTNAVEYLHKEGIKHKDLKPSNILLSANGLWLTDFGSATDFSLLSTSSTENCERGTPKYFAPEIAAFAPSGRASDIFSLGCILLEICAILRWCTLQPLRDLRPDMDKSYHANLHRIDDWFAAFGCGALPKLQHLLVEVRRMLANRPQDRPSAAEICMHMGIIDRLTTGRLDSLFSDCCRVQYMSVSEHEEKMSAMKEHYEDRMVRDALEHQVDEFARRSKMKQHETQIEALEADFQRYFESITQTLASI